MSHVTYPQQCYISMCVWGWGLYMCYGLLVQVRAHLVGVHSFFLPLRESRELSHFVGPRMSLEHSAKNRSQICQRGSPATRLGVCLMTAQKFHPPRLLPVLVACGTLVELHRKAFLARWRGFGSMEEGFTGDKFLPSHIFHQNQSFSM